MIFLPERKPISISEDKDPDSSTPETKDTTLPDADPVVDDLTKPQREYLDPETEKACETLRSVLNANIGACHVKLVSISRAKSFYTERM